MKTHYCSNMDEIMHAYIEQKLNLVDNPKFAYSSINKKNLSEIHILSNYHNEWIKIYLDNQFQYIDPIVISALRRNSPFSWNKDIEVFLDIKSSKIFSLSQKYNIVNGYTFVLHDNSHHLATLSLIIDRNSMPGIDNKIWDNRGDLQILLIDTHEKIEMFHQKGHKAEPSSSALFSPRENEILYWSSMGKTYPEIAIIIGISSRTVKYHMANVTQKLNVTNVRQAIRISVELGLINKPCVNRE